MITVHSLPGAGGVSSVSPFCAKVEIYLRMVGLPFKTVLGDGRKAPKGKLPYVDDEGARVCDSTLIVEHFERKLGSKSLDHGITATDRARAHALKRMLEESLYFTLLWSRWIDEAGWGTTREILRGILPGPLKLFVPGLIRNIVKKQVHAQGTGRHARDEIYAFAVEDVRALATLIGDGRFALGEEPRSIDATVYAFVSQLFRAPFRNPMTEHARSEPALTRYLEAMDQRFDLKTIPVLGAA